MVSLQTYSHVQTIIFSVFSCIRVSFGFQIRFKWLIKHLSNFNNYTLHYYYYFDFLREKMIDTYCLTKLNCQRVCSQMQYCYGTQII